MEAHQTTDEAQNTTTLLIDTHDENAIEQSLEWKAETANVAGWAGIPERFNDGRTAEDDGVVVYIVPSEDVSAIKQAVREKAQNANVAGWDGVAERITVA